MIPLGERETQIVEIGARKTFITERREIQHLLIMTLAWCVLRVSTSSASDEQRTYTQSPISSSSELLLCKCKMRRPIIGSQLNRENHFASICRLSPSLSRRFKSRLRSKPLIVGKQLKPNTEINLNSPLSYLQRRGAAGLGRTRGPRRGRRW